MNIHRDMGQACTTKHELRYALQQSSGRIVFVDDVPTGLKCGCICPECKQPLIAKNSKLGEAQKKEHHFAHDGGNTCKGARMTALHLLAQQMLACKKQVMLPKYNTEFVRHPSQTKKFSSVVLEQVWKDENSTRRPDCVCSQEGNNYNLWVEIYCRHKVDEERKQDIIRRQQYCIEIDFSDLLYRDYTEQDIVDRLVNDWNHRWWICCPIWDKENEAERLKKKREAEDLEQRIKEEYRERQDFIEKKKEEILRWFATGDPQLAISLGYSLDGSYTAELYSLLMPNNNFQSYIKKSPKNTAGFKIFLSVLSRYHHMVTSADEKKIERVIRQRADSKIEEKAATASIIELNEYISLNIVYRLNSVQGRQYAPKNLSVIIDKFLHDESFRKKALLLSYVFYSLADGKESNRYKEYVHEVINQYPYLAGLCLSIIKKRFRFKDLMDLQYQDLISKLQEIEKQNEFEPEQELCNLLRAVYGISIPMYKSSYDAYIKTPNWTQQSIDQVRKNLGLEPKSIEQTEYYRK